MADGAYDLKELLGGSERDFLVNSGGEQVNIAEHLKGKTVGLYFSAHWCGPCRRFTPNLAEAYGEINAAHGGLFEVVFISGDRDEASFKDYLSSMPWLAVPFSDKSVRDKLNEQFEVEGIPHLVILKTEPGSTVAKVINKDSVGVVREYGADAFPFSEDKVKELRDTEEAVKLNQTVAGVLGSRSRNYILNKNGDQVPLAELEGKVVGILFHSSSYGLSSEFTPVLSKVYEDLKHRGEPFEVVTISLDTDKSAYDSAVTAAPWPFALPFKDKSVERLIRYFELQKLPTLVILGQDGKTVHSNAADLVEGLGVGAYPFTPEKEKELEELDRKKRESQTLETILVHGDLDYVVGKDDAKVPVRDLMGKTVLIYFSAHWCPPCRRFTPRLVEVYNELKSQGKNVEVVFASSDKDEEAYKDYYGSMPWLALPLNDPRKNSLSKLFQVQGIPTLVALDPSGKTATKDARDLVDEHGAAAFPFTEARIKELDDEAEKAAGGWPERLKIEDHEHELEKTNKGRYGCDICSKGGKVWAFSCSECDYDAHPKCAMEAAAAEEAAKASKEGGESAGAAEGEKPSGIICDGDVCRRV